MGGGFGGVTAAKQARKVYPQAEIILIEKQEKIGYIPNNLLAVLGGVAQNLDELNWVTEKELEVDYQIQLRLGTTCWGLYNEQTLLVNEQERLTFDYLIIATGSRQDSRLFGEENSTRIKTFKTFNEAQKVLDLLPKCQTVAVIGAGQVGIETAEALIQAGKKVHLYESNELPLFRYLNDEMNGLLVEKIKEKGINLHLNDSVHETIEQEETVEIVSDNAYEKVDLVLLAVNTRPDNDIWEGFLKLNDDDTIWTNDYLQTSIETIYAIGDAIQVYFPILEEKVYSSLINNAIRTANIAVTNLEKLKIKDPGTFRTSANYLFGYYIGQTGLLEAEKLFYQNDVTLYKTKVTGNLVNETETRVTLLFDSKGEVLIGAEIASKEPVMEQLNYYALAIKMKTTKRELILADYVVSPHQTGIEGLLKNEVLTGED